MPKETKNIDATKQGWTNYDDSSVEEIARKRMISSTKSSLPRVILFFVISLLVLALFAGGGYLLGQQDGASETPDPTSTNSAAQSMQVKQIDKSVSGKSVEEDQKDALKAATDLINNSRTTSGDFQKRMENVAKGDFSSVTAGMQQGIEFSKGYEDNKSIQENAYNVMIGMAGKAFDGKEVKAGNDDWRKVYVHPELGVAFVPLSVYGTDQNRQLPYTMEMVYVDGQWKLLPQSLIEAISIVGNINSSSSTASSAAEATK